METSYSYAQIESGLSGYFDKASDITKTSFQPNSVLLLIITGTDALLKCGSNSTTPFRLSVDGIEASPSIVDTGITLFSGLADTSHWVSITMTPFYDPVYNWLIKAETALVTVTGAAPALAAIPMNFVSWTTFDGKSSFFSAPSYDAPITPSNQLQVNADSVGMGQISFYSQCDSIFVFTARERVKYSIDDGTIVTITAPDNTNKRRAFPLGIAFDGTQSHKYTIWDDDEDDAKLQAVGCAIDGAPTAITSTSPIASFLQLGDSITRGVYATPPGTVDIWQVGLNLNLLVSKCGVSGQTISELTTSIPGYFAITSVPDFLLLAIGRNDTESLTFQTDYTACIQALLTAGCTKILCRGLISNTNAFADENGFIQAAISSFSNPDIMYLDTTLWTGVDYQDGVHPSIAGYATLAAFETAAIIELGILVGDSIASARTHVNMSFRIGI